MASIRPRAAFVLLVLIAALGACKAEPKSAPTADAGGERTSAADVGRPPGPRIVKDEGPMPSAQTPIARAGEFVVTVGDFDRASAVALLFAPDGQTDLPAERLSLPHVHITMSRALLSQKVILAELGRRGIEPTTEELHAFLRDHPRLRRFAEHLEDPVKLAERLAPLEVSPEEYLRVGRTELAAKLLAEAMASEITDDEVWRAYAAQMTTRTAAIVAGKNIPTSEEIDTWMGDHADEIDEHFRVNQSNFRSPRMVRLHIVKPAPGDRVPDEVLERAAGLLTRGVQPQTVAKELGLQAQLDTPLVRGENPKAFAMKAGEVGWTASGARGAYAWKVIGFEESKLLEMTRPLRREIAATLLRTQGVVPGLDAKLRDAARKMRDAKVDPGDAAAVAALEADIEAIDDLSFQVSTFPQEPRLPLPNHGLAEEVITKAFELGVGQTSDPLLSRERGFVVQVLGATEASRKEFDRNRAAHRAAYVDAVKPRLVTDWVERRMNELGTQIDPKPLRIKYGVLQKE